MVILPGFQLVFVFGSAFFLIYGKQNTKNCYKQMMSFVCLYAKMKSLIICHTFLFFQQT